MRLGSAALALGHLALIACYSPDLREGLPCSESGRCPEGQSCIMPEARCYPIDGDGPSDAMCPPTSIEPMLIGRIEANDASEGDQLGGAIAISGQWMAIGADLADASGEDAGAVYMFERDG